MSWTTWGVNMGEGLGIIGFLIFLSLSGVIWGIITLREALVAMKKEEEETLDED